LSPAKAAVIATKMLANRMLIVTSETKQPREVRL
jgi:hypothetical protein